MSDQELANQFITSRLKDYDVEYILSGIADLNTEDKVDVITRIDSYINRETFLGYYFKKLTNVVASIPKNERDDVLSRSDPFINKSETHLSDMIEIIQAVHGIVCDDRDNVMSIAKKYFQEDYKPWEIRDIIYSVKHIPVDLRSDAEELADIFLIPGPNTRQKVCITLNYIRNMRKGLTKLQKIGQLIKYLHEVCRFQINKTMIYDFLHDAIIELPEFITKIPFTAIDKNEIDSSVLFLRVCEFGKFIGFKQLFSFGLLPKSEVIDEMLMKCVTSENFEIIQTLVLGVGASDEDKESINDGVAKILVVNNLIPRKDSVFLTIDEIIKKCKVDQDDGLDLFKYQNVLQSLQTALNPQPGNIDQQYVEKIAEFIL